MLEVRPEVAAAVGDGRPVVALESTLIAHGLPRPLNLETALGMEAAVREHGATPATVAVTGGRLVVGLSRAEIERLAEAEAVAKVSRRDLAVAVAGGGLGATTVAATMFAASRAGIGLLATGGLGGVHRGGWEELDLSADLAELARTPTALVCSGAKAILDLPRTLELLESLGVPVVGYGVSELPAFYAASSGLALEHRVDGPRAAARLLRAHRALEPGSGLVFAVPPPPDAAIPAAEVERWVDAALERARARGVRGAPTTPFLLAELARVSGGRTLEANRALLIENATVAGCIAAAAAAAA